MGQLKDQLLEKYKKAEDGDVVKLDEGDVLEGKFISMEESKKFPNSFAITLDTEEGQKVLFGNKILFDKIMKAQIKVNQSIAIDYKGLKENQTKTAKYHDYDLYYEG